MNEGVKFFERDTNELPDEDSLETKIVRVRLPHAIKELGTDTFSFWHKLRNISLPEGLEKIHKYCFS